MPRSLWSRSLFVAVSLFIVLCGFDRMMGSHVFDWVINLDALVIVGLLVGGFLYALRPRPSD